jgi:hypothetical protein
MTEIQRIQAVQTINEAIDRIRIAKDYADKTRETSDIMAYTNVLYEAYGMSKLLYMTGMINETQYKYIDDMIYSCEYLTVNNIRRAG